MTEKAPETGTYIYVADWHEPENLPSGPDDPKVVRPFQRYAEKHGCAIGPIERDTEQESFQRDRFPVPEYARRVGAVLRVYRAQVIAAHEAAA